VTWKTWAAAGAIPSMNYENTISFLTLVATICGLAFEYFGLKHRKAAPTPVTTKRRRKSAAALRAAKTHSLEALSRRPVSNPSTGASCRCCATRRRPTAFSTHRVYCT
jgi:hypothetical protein